MNLVQLDEGAGPEHRQKASRAPGVKRLVAALSSLRTPTPNALLFHAETVDGRPSWASGVIGVRLHITMRWHSATATGPSLGAWRVGDTELEKL